MKSDCCRAELEGSMDTLTGKASPLPWICKSCRKLCAPVADEKLNSMPTSPKYSVGTEFELAGVRGKITDIFDCGYYETNFLNEDNFLIPFNIFDRFDIKIIKPEVKFTKEQNQALIEWWWDDSKVRVNEGTKFFSRWLDEHTSK